MARPPGNFSAWWLALKLPAGVNSRAQWDAMHSVALKAYNAGRKAEREKYLSRRTP